MAFLTKKEATATTPQIVTLVVDDSGSMQGQKAKDATTSMQDLAMSIQSGNLGTHGFRFLLNILKFGDNAVDLYVAAHPDKADLNNIIFRGDSGGTNMPGALHRSAQVTIEALNACRRIEYIKEQDSPPPVCIFFSDGENMVGSLADVESAAAELKSIAHKGGSIDVVAVGIGMKPEHFPVMQKIASRPELAVNIDPLKLAEFIAKAGQTIFENGTADQIARP